MNLPSDFSWTQKEGRLGLEHRDGGTLCIDFLEGAWLRRLQSSATKKQVLAKAVGLPGSSPRLLDATAGLGRDALLLASLGCKVTAVERSAALFKLLQDAVERAEKDSKMKVLFQERLEFQLGDAKSILSDESNRGKFDVIYLDPMYPEKKKAALAKQELRLLRQLLGSDEDALELFEAARLAKPKRLVVKRPLHAPPIEPKPTHQFRGKLARYDLYLPS